MEEYDDFLPEDPEDEGDSIDKLQQLKDVFIRMIDESEEVRELLGELSSEEMTPCLVVEISVLFLDKMKKRAVRDKDIDFTRGDIEFLRSINIEMKEDKI